MDQTIVLYKSSYYYYLGRSGFHANGPTCMLFLLSCSCGDILHAAQVVGSGVLHILHTLSEAPIVLCIS